VRATVTDGEYAGRGECCPTYRNGERSNDTIAAKIFGESDITEMVRLWAQYMSVRRATTASAMRKEIQTTMRAGTARNALDSALWDLEAKQKGVSVLGLLRHEYADLCATTDTLKPLTICATVGIDTPEIMAKKAAELTRNFSILKIKLGGRILAESKASATDADRLRAIRAAAPTARLLVDANEGWTKPYLAENIRACSEVGVELIEQPVPEGCESWLLEHPTHIPFCADESFHTRADFNTIAPYYRAVNIKLDKSGGLTEALACAREAKKLGLKIMSGCMLGTSLSLAPQFYLAQFADYVDADCAYLLAKDIEYGMRYKEGKLYPPSSQLWG
jgi:L-Ala-D/L-Glu epimerase